MASRWNATSRRMRRSPKRPDPVQAVKRPSDAPGLGPGAFSFVGVRTAVPVVQAVVVAMDPHPKYENAVPHEVDRAYRTVAVPFDIEYEFAMRQIDPGTVIRLDVVETRPSRLGHDTGLSHMTFGAPARLVGSGPTMTESVGNPLYAIPMGHDIEPCSQRCHGVGPARGFPELFQAPSGDNSQSAISSRYASQNGRIPLQGQSMTSPVSRAAPSPPPHLSHH